MFLKSCINKNNKMHLFLLQYIAATALLDQNCVVEQILEWCCS